MSDLLVIVLRYHAERKIPTNHSSLITYNSIASYFSPKTSATALYVTLPSTTFNPNARAGSSLQACLQPLHARATV